MTRAAGQGRAGTAAAPKKKVAPNAAASGIPTGAAPRKGGRPGQAAPRSLRLFFGLPLPEAVSTELLAAQARLSSNWRRVEADQLHLTLAYIPGVPQDKVALLETLGRRLALEAAPLTLRLRGTGYHPNVGSPRVWFVKVEGEGLTELAARLGAELETLGFAPEGRFQPHITLARKKGPAPRLPPLSFTQAWQANQISLIHTFLPRDKTGPVYDTVNRFHLSGSAHLSAAPTAPRPVPNPAPTANPVPTANPAPTVNPATAGPVSEE